MLPSESSTTTGHKIFSSALECMALNKRLFRIEFVLKKCSSPHFFCGSIKWQQSSTFWWVGGWREEGTDLLPSPYCTKRNASTIEIWTSHFRRLNVPNKIEDTDRQNSNMNHINCNTQKNYNDVNELVYLISQKK